MTRLVRRKNNVVFTLTLLTALLMVATAFAADLHVPTDTYPTISDALGAASDGDEIVLKDGTYKGNGNKYLHNDGKKITVRSENGYSGCIIDLEGTAGPAFLFSDATISGITITNVGSWWAVDMTDGEVSNCLITANSGGGIRVYGNTKISNCTISNNTGGAGIAFWNEGAPVVENCLITGNSSRGISGYSGSTALITNCIVSNNSAETGGGIHCGGNEQIDNCTITNNTADDWGGGIGGGTPTITGCVISGNQTTGNGRGGGISTGGTITNCTIQNNIAAGDGGGVYAGGGASVTNCLITGNVSNGNHGGGINASFGSITNCTIKNNSVVNGCGGGIACYGGLAHPQITGCTITENTAREGGGVYFSDTEPYEPALEQCTISNNTAVENGGGIMCILDTNPKIRNCTISSNSVEDGDGGGIYISDALPKIRNCVIEGNTVTKGNGNGGGIYCERSSVDLDRIIVRKNAATYGGGILFSENAPVLVNSFVTENSASQMGGGIAADTATNLTVAFATVAGNTAGTGGGGFASKSAMTTILYSIFWNNSSTEIGVMLGSAPTVFSSDIKGGFAGDGNFDADPKFVSANNYHLLAGSPCIDYIASAPFDLPDEDVDENVRPYGNGYDIGADEFAGGQAISGSVTSGGSAVPGATITLTGAASLSTTTDGSGTYSFSGLANGTYTITPSRDGYTFSPSNISIIVNGADLAGQDFTATFVGYSVSGTVTNAGAGITVKLSGAESQTTKTDENGNYEFTELSNGAYTVTPSKTGYAFIPKSINVNVNGANLTDQDFAFAAITVTSPKGGQVWKAGTTHPISWTYKGSPGDFVKIELLKDGSATLLKSGVSIGTNGKGSWNWTIPKKKTPGTDYKIRITSTTVERCKDASNKNFTITGPTITVTSPNGGETWQAGTQHTISWSYTDNPGSYVKVELLKGETASVLKSSVSIGKNGTGSCNWTIPKTKPPRTDYRIRVTSTAYNLWTDTTDATFTIKGTTASQSSTSSDE